MEIPNCRVLEDAVFTSDNKTWYLTCMGSQKIIVGDAVTDTPIRSISLLKPYPHGISLNEDIDRIIVTSTDPPDGISQPGETLAGINTFKNQGLNPNCIILLPEWSTGHGH